MNAERRPTERAALQQAGQPSMIVAATTDSRTPAVRGSSPVEVSSRPQFGARWLTPPSAAVAAGADQLGLLLSALEHPGPVSVAWKLNGDFDFKANLTLDQALRLAGSHATRDTWFSVNPTLAEGGGRGRAEHVVGLTSLYADLDVKVEGLDSIEACWAVVDDLSERLGVTPSAVVDSGHGLQPYWRLDGVRWDRGDQDSRLVASGVLTSFRLTVEESAAAYGGNVDAVYDLARILRVPGTMNVKEPDRPVMAQLLHLDPDVQPLHLDEIRQLLGSPSAPAKRQADPRPSTALASAGRSAECLMTQVEEATEGQRNSTLNRAAFVLARDGHWSPEVAARVREGAISGGHEEAQVDRTIASARSAAEDVTREADRWLEQLLGDLERRRARNRVGLACTGRHLRDLAVQVGQPVGLSCRNLAEQLQIWPATAANHLKWLTKRGWLTLAGSRTDADRSRRYRLSTPEASNLDSQPCAVELYDGGVAHGRLSKFARSHTGLYSHDAFSRIKGSTTMPKSCAVVLEVLTRSPHEIRTVKEISQSTTYSPSTVLRAVHVLESAGFLCYTPRIGLRLLESPSTRADAWAAWSGATGNREERRRRHEADRAARARSWQQRGGQGSDRAVQDASGP